jgi:tRNA/tmRNA/rRNA uracil-C5-methylase (TrmA/RlmC/RlmD family)
MSYYKVDYYNSKVYKIESHLGPNIYIGGTAQPSLSQVLTQFKNSYKIWQKNKDNKKYKKKSVYDIFDEYGVENCIITLIHYETCISKDHLNEKIHKVISDTDCINKNKIYIQPKERELKKRETYKKWYEENKEKVKEKLKTRTTCICGCNVLLNGLKEHESSQKHKKFLKSNIPNIPKPNM